jgi:hypothetical protein
VPDVPPVSYSPSLVRQLHRGLGSMPNRTVNRNPQPYISGQRGA